MTWLSASTADYLRACAVCHTFFCSKFYFRVTVSDSTLLAEHAERFRTEP